MLEFLVLLNAYRACLGRPSQLRSQYEYKIELQQSDGSTISARYKEPRNSFRMPIDLRVATEDEKRRRIALRKPQYKQLKDVR